MRNLLLGALLLNAFLGFSQQNFTAIDTMFASCKVDLNQEYKKKFETINKTIATKNPKERTILKEIYSEIQESFLEKIESNDFMCSSDINHYLQGLMAEILMKNNITAQEYKILLSKNSEINAYNTGDGTVVINYGLFLAVENEDELVFVICHEIGHQHLNHVKTEIESFTRLSTSEDIIAKIKEIKKQKYGRATKATDLMKNIRYQNYSKRRKKEIEADSIGFAFYKKTLRNPKAAINILAKLNDADLESDSLTVADYKKIFEKNGFIAKQKYFDEEKSLFSKYDYNKEMKIDSLKSHPDCTTRIKLIEKYNDKSLGENFNSPQSFLEIKKNTTYQNLFNLFSSERYGISLYEALKLYKYNDQDAVLKKIIYLNLLKIYDSRVNYTINRYVPSHDNLVNSASLNRFVSYINNIKLNDFQTIINNFKS